MPDPTPFLSGEFGVPGADFCSKSMSLHRLSAGPSEAGIGVIVTSTRGALVRLHALANSLEGVTTLVIVLPPSATDPTTNNAHEYVERLAWLLSSAQVHTVAGHSAAGYLAAGLAKAREAWQVPPPRLVLLEPPLPSDLMTRPLSDLLCMPEPALRRFTESLGAGSLTTAPRGTPEFRRQVIYTFLTHRIELDAALSCVEPADLLAPLPLALDIYTEWAGWVSLSIQLATVTYGGPTVSVEGKYTAAMEAAARAQRFAQIRESFPQARFQETDLLHLDLVSEAVLRPHFSPPW